nr:MAG TPA: hypothetical protein [Caudoviricetes sp.]
MRDNSNDGRGSEVDAPPVIRPEGFYNNSSIVVFRALKK